MKHLFNKKSEKSPKPSQKHIPLGTPTNTTVEPLAYRAELDVNPKDEKSPVTLWIGFHDKWSEDREPPAPEIATPGVVVSGTERGNDLTRKNVSGTREEGEPVAPRAPGTDYRDTVLGVPAILVDVPKEAADGFGPLKSVLRAISAVYSNYEETVAVENKIEDLISRIAVLGVLFNTRPDGVAEQRRRAELIRKLDGIEGQLQSLSEKLGLQQPIDHVQDDEEAPALLEDLRETISDYQMMQHLAKYEEGCKLIDAANAAVLNNFRCAQEAEYRHGDRRGCLKGTRRAILDEIELWTRDFGRPPTYWLNGLAGTGKSTIAQTVAERVFAEGRLGASFFCSRDFEDRSNLHFIFPTLAVQLARRYAGFRSIFVPLVQSDPGIAYESLYNQMNKLIVQPLVKSAISTVIVIDALDECKDEEPASAILSVLGQFVSEIPRVKFFLTGRPEPRIREGFRLPLMAKATDVFVLHAVESGRVDNDIRLFFRHKLSELASRRRGLDGWPTKEQLDLLCRRAAGLFIYAVATARFIDHKNNSPKKQLDRLLQTPESSIREGKTALKANTTLDSLYTSILQDAFGEDDPEDDHKVRSVLGAVILAANPLSASTIAALLGFDTEDVFPVMSSAHSFLILQEDVNHPARPFHKSFPDFIVDPTRCTNQRFRVSPPDHHTELLVGCLELMNRRLEQNICKLPDGVVNSEADDLKERTERFIDHSLQYACRSWHKHLVCTTPADTAKITSILHQFLEGKFLFWLEVLSVLGSAREAVDALEVAAKWLDASPTLDLVNDYSRFLIASFEVISTSAPHIYHSALSLSPRTSIVRKLYGSYARPLARVVEGLPTSWEPAVATAYYPASVLTAAWSPCSQYIAVARVGATTVEILDAVTLKRLNTLKSLQGGTQLLSFSPDSCLLTWLSNKWEFISWDLQTGGPVGTIPSEPRATPAECISSTYSMDAKIIAVAHRDLDDITITTISTYNLPSGTHTHSHRVSGGRIVASIWTHGECLRFAAVRPGSITIWEAGFTSIHTPVEVKSLPAPDNIGDSAEYLFLPFRSRLAFILEEAVLVWDAQDSKLLLNFVGGDRPTKMSFSPDGRFFAYGTTGLEVCLWKESPAGYTLHQKLTSNFRGVIRPLLSPNGESIIMHNHSTIQLSRTADPTPSLSNVPTKVVKLTAFILNFSPDETLVAVARLEENTAKVLNLKSGNSRLVVDTGMKIFALGVTESTLVVVGEGKVATWNIPASDCTPNARADINDSIHSTAFDYSAPSDPMVVPYGSISSDLTRVVIKEAPIGLRVYAVSTGRCLTTTTLGLRPWFTPDGHEVWSGDRYSKEGWAVVEDGESGLTKLEPLRPTAHPLGGFPWQSSSGYEVRRDGWAFGPNGRRLFWLPHHWSSGDTYRTWGGRFLGLLHRELPAAIIIEFDE